MRRGYIQGFCHGTDSTSTLNQQNLCHNLPSSYMAAGASSAVGGPRSTSLTLEQMILQLDLEEEAARRAKLGHDVHNNVHRRMSCVNINNSDILRSARDALNQYPRFSLDGKDAMYRSSFKHPVICTRVCRESNDYKHEGYKVDIERTLRMPKFLAGENVIWCEPGIVAKLMGLEVVPVPVRAKNDNARRSNYNASASVTTRKHNLRRLARKEFERERLLMATRHVGEGKVGRDEPGCSSVPIWDHDVPYCVMKQPPDATGLSGVGDEEERRYRRTRYVAHC